MKYITILTIAALTIIGCKDGYTNSNNALVKQVSADYIQSITVSDNSISFIIICSVGGKNYTFVRADEIKNNLDVNYKIFGFPDNGVYPALTYPMEAKILFSKTAPGTYKFHFEKLNGQPIDTVLVVQ